MNWSSLNGSPSVHVYDRQEPCWRRGGRSLSSLASATSGHMARTPCPGSCTQGASMQSGAAGSRSWHHGSSGTGLPWSPMRPLPRQQARAAGAGAGRRPGLGPPWSGGGMGPRWGRFLMRGHGFGPGGSARAGRARWPRREWRKMDMAIVARMKGRGVMALEERVLLFGLVLLIRCVFKGLENYWGGLATIEMRRK